MKYTQLFSDETVGKEKEREEIFNISRKSWKKR